MNVVSESSVSFDEFFVLRVHRRSLIAKIRNHPCYGVAQHGDELRSGKGCPDLNGVLHRQVTGGGSELDGLCVTNESVDGVLQFHAVSIPVVIRFDMNVTIRPQLSCDLGTQR